MRDVLIAGDTLDFANRVPDYPPADGWTLKFRLIPHVAGPAPIELTAGVDGDEYRTQLAPASTAVWTAGDYALTAWVEKPGARHNVETNPELPRQVRILPNPATVGAYDSRSTAAQNLERIETLLSGRASTAVQEYEINGRRLVNYKPEELIVLASYFRNQVQREEMTARLASGMGNPRHVFARFRNA